MKPNEQECIAKWRELLTRFNVLIDNNPAPDKIRSELIAIKEEAKNSGRLTQRQVDSLVGKIDNYLACRYGNTKRNITFQAA